MKICFLGLENLPVLAREYNSHGIGGEQVQHTLLAKALARRGYQVSMVVFDYGQPDGAAWHGVTTYKAYRASAGIPGLRYLHPRWSGVWAALKRADADVYYLSCAGMQVGLAALFCRRYRKKLIFKIAHDTDCDPKNLLIQYWRDKKLYEYGLRRCDGILAQSVQQQTAMQANYGLPSIVSEMLVDSPEQEYPRSKDVLWVNNLRQFKRPDLLLELAKMLPQLQFHMVGGAQPGFSALYDEIAEKAKAIPNLHFHGRIPYHDMDAMYGSAKVFVNTSDNEGFPNSYLQAWIRGTPVVAFFDPDQLIAREKLGSAVTALEQMAQRILHYALDNEAWRQTSRRCREYMADTYGEERILAPYLTLIHREGRYAG